MLIAKHIMMIRKMPKDDIMSKKWIYIVKILGNPSKMPILQLVYPNVTSEASRDPYIYKVAAGSPLFFCTYPMSNGGTHCGF